MDCSGKEMSLLQKAEWKHFIQIICTRTTRRLIRLSLPLKITHKLLWNNSELHALTQKGILTVTVVTFFQAKWLCTTRSKTSEANSIEALHFDYIQDGKYQPTIHVHIYMHMDLHKYKNQFSLLRSKVGQVEKSCVSTFQQ